MKIDLTIIRRRVAASDPARVVEDNNGVESAGLLSLAYHSVNGP